jgi:hypothetical protein
MITKIKRVVRHTHAVKVSARSKKFVLYEPQLKCLRIKIHNEWSASEFTYLFDSINKLFLIQKRIFFIMENFKKFKKIHYASKDHPPFAKEIEGLVENLTAIVGEGNYANYSISDQFTPLTVIKINFSSPGSVDFLGIGKAIDALSKILFYYLPNKKAKEEINTIKIQNDARLIKNLKDLGMEPQEIQKLIYVREINRSKIKKLITDDKILDVEVIKYENYEKDED